MIDIPYSCTSSPTCPGRPYHSCETMAEVHAEADGLEVDRDHVVHMAAVLLFLLGRTDRARSDLSLALAVQTGYPLGFVRCCIGRAQRAGVLDPFPPPGWLDEHACSVAFILDVFATLGVVDRWSGESAQPEYRLRDKSDRILVRWDRSANHCQGASDNGRQCQRWIPTGYRYCWSHRPMPVAWVSDEEMTTSDAQQPDLLAPMEPADPVNVHTESGTSAAPPEVLAAPPPPASLPRFAGRGTLSF